MYFKFISFRKQQKEFIDKKMYSLRQYYEYFIHTTTSALNYNNEVTTLLLYTIT